MKKHIFSFIIFTFSIATSWASDSYYDIGLECKDIKTKEEKVLINSIIKNNSNSCFLSISCIKGKFLAVPFHFTCSKKPMFFGIKLKDKNKLKLNSAALIGDNLYFTIYSDDHISGKLYKATAGSQDVENVLDVSESFLYLKEKEGKYILEKWIPSQCSPKTVSIPLWKGCFITEEVSKELFK